MAQGPRAGRHLADRRGGRRAGAFVVLAVLLVVSGCGGTDGPSGSSPGSPETEPPSSEPTRSARPSVSPSTSEVPDPTLPTARPSESIQLSGTVRRAPEERSVVLEAGAVDGYPARAWVLVGPVSGLRDGESVTVSGRPDRNALTTGQRGPVLLVTEVLRD